MIEKMRNIVNVLTISMGISVVGGLSHWDTSGIDTLLGLVDVVCIVWLFILTRKPHVGV